MVPGRCSDLPAGTNKCGYMTVDIFFLPIRRHSHYLHHSKLLELQFPEEQVHLTNVLSESLQPLKLVFTQCNASPRPQPLWDSEVQRQWP